MNINELIALLKVSGHNTKHQVLWMLENATIEELLELRRSITERINIMSVGTCDICGQPISKNDFKNGVCTKCLNEVSSI